MMFFSLYCLFIFMTIVRFFIIASKKIRYHIKYKALNTKKKDIDHLMKSSKLTHLDLEYYYYWDPY